MFGLWLGTWVGPYGGLRGDSSAVIAWITRPGRAGSRGDWMRGESGVWAPCIGLREYERVFETVNRQTTQEKKCMQLDDASSNPNENP